MFQQNNGANEEQVESDSGSDDEEQEASQDAHDNEITSDDKETTVEDDVDDLHIAWEALEVSRRMCEENPSEEMDLLLSEVVNCSKRVPFLCCRRYC